MLLPMADKGISASRTKHHKGVLLIAIMKLLKGLMLLILGLGAISLLHRDVTEVAEHWLRFFHFDPSGKIFYTILDKLKFVDDRRLHQLSAGTFISAAVVLVEGVGLLFEKRWAEWLTVLFTGSFIPYEIYEIFHRLSWIKVGVLGANVIILGYLIFCLRDRPSAAVKTKVYKHDCDGGMAGRVD